MITENQKPSVMKEGKMIAMTMTPMAMNPPILRKPPRKEKSFLVVKATKVSPAKSRPVTPPALMIRVASPVIFMAMSRSGRKMRA